MWKRSFTSSSSPLLKKIGGNKRTSFDKYLAVETPKKPWQSNNNRKSSSTNKEDWFKSKYAHIHARQKLIPKNDPYGKKAAHEKKLYDIKKDNKLQRLSHRQNFTQYGNSRDVLQMNPLLEYIFGTNSVLAALSNPRRHIFNKLYYYGNESFELINNKLKELNLQIPLQESNKHELNQLSKFNLHNNIVLEAKPLEDIEIKNLGSINQLTDNNTNVPSTTFQVNLINQQEIPIFKEDKVMPDVIRQVNFNSRPLQGKTFPIGIFLDEITDPHNVGAIIRSAYFLGADFIVMTKKNSSSLTPVVSKASSGAMEWLPIYHVDDPIKFFKESQKEENGSWTFITSHCTSGSNENPATQFIKDKTLPIEDLDGMLQRSPTILVMGNEGSGVRSSLIQISDYLVEIPYNGPPPSTNITNTVDSLNVSVAAAILMNHLLPCP
ncbi:similar to Saccharomyces cerevisiae YOR201C MRM1 Ribose methyltransferase that modifies a functionally critical, conserved nucleotide in mitochondrial 21S rRNA [Maudiozyma saulgeensis]|uniref:rRNA methyltransferase 1, mitochondrial n=1 Tax=Maudiozyma saulgeensis TaxID=1789683 RepID=A0A1X7R1M4_9SACH|nr:similar to Saccharomyces cerevisiae YOR201C MRM1 Ribose methyltransferase that modifies a functionally critical, conserved nucleotide in mitochondrial 21S rRNA [Kazachstania saulgeensis]